MKSIYAVAYAIICYVTAYYKTYYPNEFICAMLTSLYINGTGEKEKFIDKVDTIINEANNMGIKFLPLDVNKSKWKFTVEEEGIRLGFCALTGFSKVAYEELMLCVPFNNDSTYIEQIYEKTAKKNLGKLAILSLIFNELLGERITTYEKYCELRKEEPIYGDIYICNGFKPNLYATHEELEFGFFKGNFIYIIKLLILNR